MDPKYDRRDFLKLGGTVGAGLALGSTSLSGDANLPKPGRAQAEAAPIDPVRIGLIGVGRRGTHLLRDLLKVEGVEVRAVCDIVEGKVARGQQITQQAGQRTPAGYSRGERDFERLCQRDDLDLVINAAPWKWHVPMCVAAMKAGKHAATEVPAATTIDGCWQLVETAEKTNRYCVMLENTCYDRTELMVLNMVRKGLLGELVHSDAGYCHDARAGIRDPKHGLHRPWGRPHWLERNGDLYPTHGLGPVAQCMNINRGDRLDYLVSMSCKTRGVNAYAAERFGPEDPRANIEYKQGDVTTSLIRTANGLTITLKFDCCTPRPYSRIFLLQGTKAIVRKYPEGKIYVDGKSPAHSWEALSEYAEQYEHPLWKTLAEKSKGSGHGGMDYVMFYRLIKCLRTGSQPDMDVYDAAAWSAVSELSERSIANRSKPVEFPDFTQGRWKTNPPLEIVEA